MSQRTIHTSQRTRAEVPASLAIASLASVLAAGCIRIEQLDFHHDNPETYNGPVEQNTTTDADVDVEEVAVEAEVNTEVDAVTQVDADTQVDTDVGIGGGDDDGERDESVVSAIGDGVGFELTYHGPIDEHAILTPQLNEADAARVTSVEWALVDVVLDVPTVLDDEDGFVWGDPRDDGSYLLALRATTDAFTWDTSSSLCVDGACVGRAISAACVATVVMTVTFDDGVTASASAAHESARPACW